MAKANNIIELNKTPLKPGKKNHQGEGGGKPRVFKTDTEILDAFLDYVTYVIDNDYCEVPTKLNFAKWMEIDPKTIYNTINKYFPDNKKDYQQILSDVLTTGAMLGKWDRTITIFALKNWCDWSDKRENTNINEAKPKLATKEEAERMVKDFVNNSK